MSHSDKPSRRDLLKAGGAFATVVTIPAWLWGCGGEVDFASDPNIGGAERNDEWEDIAEGLEAGEIYTQGSAGPWAGKEAVHVPRVTFNAGEGSITVLIKHGMSAEHWIPVIYLRDQNGLVVGLKDYGQDAYDGTAGDADPTVTFELPAGTKKVTAYAYCNLHDHWVAEQPQRTGDPGGVEPNEDWESLGETYEAGPIYTQNEAGEWAGKEAVHVPQITLNEGNGSLSVLVMHEMNDAHWIPAIYIRDQAGVIVGLKDYGIDAWNGDAGDGSPTATFVVPQGTTQITAFAYCNLHDHWSVEDPTAT
jgi:desulfoferrodoxin (superoxide reductase-like protein)